jgi:hypothetical protein
MPVMVVSLGRRSLAGHRHLCPAVSRFVREGTGAVETGFSQPLRFAAPHQLGCGRPVSEIMEP